MTEAITIQESSRLVELERKIKSGLETFVEVGEALMEILDAKLYRIEHATFEDYCKRKWNLERRHAYRLIDGAKAVANVSNWTQGRPNIEHFNNPATQLAPIRESQARPLTRLPAEKQPEAWEKAVERAGGEQPTARQVQEAVVEVLEPEPEQPSDPPPSEGMEIAKRAIRILEKIDHKDTERKRGLAHIKHWISLHS